MRAILYFLFGAVAGAIVALLFAPQSGKELRASIQSTADRNWQAVQADWQTGIETIHSRLDQVQSDLKQALQKQDEAETESVTAG